MSQIIIRVAMQSIEHKWVFLHARRLSHLSDLSVYLSVCPKVYCGKTADWIHMPS